MTDTLFELLTGSYLDGIPTDQRADDEVLIHSVMDHLTRLFNTRRGSVPHLPDYGLPDVVEIYQGIPYTVEYLKQCILENIQKYEPRLICHSIIPSIRPGVWAILQFRITGILKSGQSVEIRTLFNSDGKAQLADR